MRREEEVVLTIEGTQREMKATRAEIQKGRTLVREKKQELEQLIE